MHSDTVTIMSKAMLMMSGEAACAPRMATSSGTPMKPVFGKAATSAPKAASFHPIRALGLRVTVRHTTISAHTPQTPATPASVNCPIGAPAPNRNSMHGSAKYRTKTLSPGMAASGNAPLRAATYPTPISAKKGTVTRKICSTPRLSLRRPMPPEAAR